MINKILLLDSEGLYLLKDLIGFNKYTTIEDLKQKLSIIDEMINNNIIEVNN